MASFKFTPLFTPLGDGKTLWGRGSQGPWLPISSSRSTVPSPNPGRNSAELRRNFVAPPLLLDLVLKDWIEKAAFTDELRKELDTEHFVEHMNNAVKADMSALYETAFHAGAHHGKADMIFEKEKLAATITRLHTEKETLTVAVLKLAQEKDEMFFTIHDLNTRIMAMTVEPPPILAEQVPSTGPTPCTRRTRTPRSPPQSAPAWCGPRSARSLSPRPRSPASRWP